MFQELSPISPGLYTLFGAGIVACTTWLVNHYQRRRDRIKREEDKRKEASRAFLDESLLLLERAYETFTRCGTSPPRSDRILWLSTARMIVRFQNMRLRLTEPEHRNIADEHEEYWRLRFYTVLHENTEHFTPDYFFGIQSIPRFVRDTESGVIDSTSIAVIFDFATWKEGMSDPLDSVNAQELFARRAVLRDFPGVREHLEG